MTPSVPLEIGSKGGTKIGPLSKVGSESLLGVHSPDEVMDPFGRVVFRGCRWSDI